MIKLPYGKANFPSIITRGYYYADKTRYIRILENMGGDYLFFIRPRRFGKSLFISVLENYYDIQQRAQFATLFGALDIGREPTPERNSYLILRLDFSGIRTDAGMETLQRSFTEKVRIYLQGFAEDYRAYLPNWPDLHSRLAAAEDLETLTTLLLDEVRKTGQRVYLLIDEYDNFANELIAGRKEQDYLSIVGGTGFVRTFYKVIKEYTQRGAGVIQRLFMTGVSPLMLDDLTSGFNITQNITLFPTLNEMLGLTTAEVEQLVARLLREQPRAVDAAQLLRDLQEYYNGYLFHVDAKERVFNTDMVLYFLDYLMQVGTYPPEILDMNVRTDYSKLQMLMRLDDRADSDFSQLQQLVTTGEIAAPLVSRFSLTDLGAAANFVSLLFYLGLVTLKEQREGDYIFQIPNHAIARLYWEYFARVVAQRGDVQVGVNDLRARIRQLAYDGELRPLWSYLWEHVLKIISTRDFIRFDERGIKLLFLSFLSWSELYIPFSELELQRGYADVVLAPDPRFRDVPYSWIIEFKYLKAEDDTAAARARKLTEGAAQVQQYRQDERWTRVTANTEVRGAVILVVDGQEWEIREELA